MHAEYALFEGELNGEDHGLGLGVASIPLFENKPTIVSPFGEGAENYHRMNLAGHFPHVHLLGLFLANEFGYSQKLYSDKRWGNAMYEGYLQALQSVRGSTFSHPRQTLLNGFHAMMKQRKSSDSFARESLQFPMWSIWNEQDLKEFIERTGPFAPDRSRPF